VERIAHRKTGTGPAHAPVPLPTEGD
jgi:hypothetical protein